MTLRRERSTEEEVDTSGTVRPLISRLESILKARTLFARRRSYLHGRRVGGLKGPFSSRISTTTTTKKNTEKRKTRSEEEEEEEEGASRAHELC